MSSQDFLPGFLLTDQQTVANLSLAESVDRAIALLRKCEPPEGFYMAFSGGKDSCATKRLLQMSGVKFDAHYNNTTIDPPELVRWLKKFHPDVQWEQPRLGNMFHAIAEGPSGVAPPTKFSRWCCREYKERGGENRVCVFGVRAAESAKRAHRWAEVSIARHGRPAICPIVYWDDERLWGFIHEHTIPYCPLYDEGWDRLGCIGCPLINAGPRQKQFDRWPHYEKMWKQAVIANWEKWKDIPRKDGGIRFQGKFASAEEFWNWWMTDERPDPNYEDCQSGILWTNEE